MGVVPDRLAARIKLRRQVEADDGCVSRKDGERDAEGHAALDAADLPARGSHRVSDRGNAQVTIDARSPQLSPKSLQEKSSAAIRAIEESLP